MSADKLEDKSNSPKSLDEGECSRKRIRLDISSRMSWSLMDRKTDQEVLQEMGVSLLEPDESEAHSDGALISTQKSGVKRKRDIENVNPNVNSITSPRARLSPKSPKVKSSPGSSKVKSPRSSEKSKPLLQLSEQEIVPYLTDEETPLGQAVSASRKLAQQANLLGQHSSPTFRSHEGEVENLRTKYDPMGEDSFSILSDEMILCVFKWLPKRTLAHCMTVCKRWHRIARDESLWQRLDLGNKTIRKGVLRCILARQPNIIRLASSEIGEWHPKTPASPSRIQYLDLSMSTIDLQTLDCLLERCPALKKLSLENLTIGDETAQFISRCINLETLNLTMTHGVTDIGLKYILDGCKSLQSLNVSWCCFNEDALEVLVTSLPTKLQRLNLAGARKITDDMVEMLVSRCPRLLELDLSDCSLVGARSMLALRRLAAVEHLAVSRCYLLPPHNLCQLSSMPSLQYLDVWGMLQSASLSALKAALPGIQINQFMFSAIARPTVGTRRTSIWGLRTRECLI